MKFIFLLTTLALSFTSAESDVLSWQWKGQASLLHASSFEGSLSESPTTLRYIPQLRLDYQFSSSTRIGLDAAVDVYNHSLGDSLVSMNGELYRFTLRYDTPNTQYRIGLQKINFGPARMLRILQWFDQLDPRDPLALSPGVWAAMGRYYFENGVNLRLWTMADAPDPQRDYWGDMDKWPWDAGARMELPISAGTLGLTAHSMDMLQHSQVTENRLAIDVRLDAVVGLWSEAMFSRTEEPYHEWDNISAMAGVDYTFGIGNGLYLALEMATSWTGNVGDDMPWQARTMALMGSYTLGLSDGLTAYLYAIDMQILESQYMPMIGWQHTRGNWLVYLALYDMPEFPYTAGMALPAGTGIQLNIAFNH